MKKNRLSILLVILGLLISSCSQSADSKPKLQEVQVQKRIQVSATPKTRVYRVNWSYCAAPGKISIAESDGCVRTYQPFYYWLDSGVEPKGILIRRSVPMAGSDSVFYEASILARGCYPKYLEPMPLDFYATNISFSVHKDVTGIKEVVEGLKLEVEPLSPEEEQQLAQQFNGSAYSIPAPCRNYPNEKEKLAPYLPSS